MTNPTTFNDADDALVFLDEQPPRSTHEQTEMNHWRVMIIDDDPDVHTATMFALGNLEIQSRHLSFLHAYNAEEAKNVLQKETDIAVILLDVVMEHQDAGLMLVNYIRNNLNLKDVRIILRTGQPGYAPEIDAIRDYDINDYKTKSELTRTKLYTTVTAAIRSYEQICSISQSQLGLESIVHVSAALMAQKTIAEFSHCLLKQLSLLFRKKIEGFVCLENNKIIEVISTTDSYNHLIEEDGCLHDPNAIELITPAKTSRRHQLSDGTVALYFETLNQHNYIVHVDTGSGSLAPQLIEVLCSNIAVGLNNVMLSTSLHRYAYFDPLTNSPNRLKLLQYLGDTLATDLKKYSVLSLVDIDHFAETNDALGHQFGDALLISVYKRLEENFSQQCLIGRVGSDTFALLGNNEYNIPERIFQVFKQPFNVDEQEVQLSCTIGLINLGDYDGNASDALKDTNIALKRAKSQQRSSYSYFTVDMGVEIRERVRMMHALRTAFENERLFVMYQPQVNTSNGHAIGAEALVRWKSEDGKFIPPDQFIPIAEYSGLIVNIGEWVLRTSCYELKRLHNLGYADFKMAVNVSQAQFSHPNFLHSIEAALADTQINPHCLDLEITESMAMTDPEVLISTLQYLKKLGVTISIDDFGTGFSSLSHLQKLNVDKLKIDRAFVNEISDSEHGGSIAKMIVQLSQNLNIKVIAEGVETEKQVEILQKFGCFQAQGYFYSRPLVREDLQTWLANHR